MKISCITSKRLIPYQEAVALMEERVQKIIKKEAQSAIWLLEHEHVYTAGARTLDSELLQPKFPIYKTNRGGKGTYHGPGQRVVYLMLDLNMLYNNKPDIRDFVSKITKIVISTLEHFNIKAYESADNVGVWVGQEAQCDETTSIDQKIASIGIKVKKWVTSHGIAINVSTNLEHFNDIVPCGITSCKTASIESLGQKISLKNFDKVLLKEFIHKFNCEISYEEQCF